MGELQEFQRLVISNARQAKGIGVGEKAPDFILPDAFGKHISLSEFAVSGPVVLKFYRGEWCPVCNLDLRAIQKYLSAFKSCKANVLAVSPQKPDDALTMQQKNELGFVVLSDSSQEVIKAYKLQFDPGEDYHKRRNLALLNGNGSKFLPVTATFIINTRMTVVAAHVEADYTKRMSPEDILTALKKMSIGNHA